MSLSMYQASVPVMQRRMRQLIGILDKAEAHCTAKKIDPDVLINARLYPDMFPLRRQVQIATDMAKAAAARLSGSEVPTSQDTDKTFADLKARLQGTDERLSLDSLRLMRAEAPVDCSKARRELGWQPRPVEESIREAAKFWVGLRNARRARTVDG